MPSALKENATAVNQNEAASNSTNSSNNNNAYCIQMGDMTLRDIQVKCLIAFNSLMNKSHRNKNELFIILENF
jgi:hypothetical protein